MSIQPAYLVIAGETVLVLSGLAFLGWLFIARAGKALRARPPQLRPWTISVTDALLFLWFIFTVGAVGQITVHELAGKSLHRLAEGPTLEIIVYGSMFHVGAVLAWLIAAPVLRRRAAPLPDPAPAPKAGPGKTAGMALLTLLGALPLVSATAMLWEQLLAALGLPTEHQELIDLIAGAKSPVLVTLMISLALIIAPVAEELVFRAGLFRFLRTRAPRWVAFVSSAGLFALLHSNWASALPLFVLGLIFAAAYECTGRIAVPMIAHALFNLNTLLIVLSGASDL